VFRAVKKLLILNIGFILSMKGKYESTIIRMGLPDSARVVLQQYFITQTCRNVIHRFYLSKIKILR